MSIKLILILLLVGGFAYKRYHPRIRRDSGSSTVALFYDTNEEDEEGFIIREKIHLFNIEKVIKSEGSGKSNSGNSEDKVQTTKDVS